MGRFGPSRGSARRVINKTPLAVLLITPQVACNTFFNLGDRFLKVFSPKPSFINPLSFINPR